VNSNAGAPANIDEFQQGARAGREHHNLYQEHEQIARERMSARDIEDWPVVALAILLGPPIWTEDQDFFDSGVATWTTDRVELYLQDR
jgi:predicted nucleic acid-binding protein